MWNQRIQRSDSRETRNSLEANVGGSEKERGEKMKKSQAKQ